MVVHIEADMLSLLHAGIQALPGVVTGGWVKPGVSKEKLLLLRDHMLTCCSIVPLALQPWINNTAWLLSMYVFAGIC